MTSMASMTSDGENQMERIHGGNWRWFQEQYGRLPLDFSASVSPLGVPDSVCAAVSASLSDCDRYPDPECSELRLAIAERFGLSEGMILCGNGASDLLDRLALAVRPRRALLTAPSYGEYRLALERAGCGILEYNLREEREFQIGADFLEMLDLKPDLVLLCEPNNPTGRTTKRALLDAIANRCDELGILLVLDECFNDFLDEPGKHSMLGEAGNHSVMILRAFTKFYGMAGLRLGWCVCRDRELLARMGDAGQPWAVSTPAMIAGMAALGDTEYAAALREVIGRERPRQMEALGRCGCRVIPGEANYLLFFDPTENLTVKLAEQGILLRDCRDFSGLRRGWYRAAIRTARENERLIEALDAIHRGADCGRIIHV